MTIEQQQQLENKAIVMERMLHNLKNDLANQLLINAEYKAQYELTKEQLKQALEEIEKMRADLLKVRKSDDSKAG